MRTSAFLSSGASVVLTMLNTLTFADWPALRFGM